ncbi:hypothetical protein NKH84_13730 [Mesorhizobium sp. M0902]|uniref:hypothetical protein n=1 Tax=Mesorhizobium sp. M0902 TaxID=2957021 RepID=UPI00333B0530
MVSNDREQIHLRSNFGYGNDLIPAYAVSAKGMGDTATERKQQRVASSFLDSSIWNGSAFGTDKVSECVFDKCRGRSGVLETKMELDAAQCATTGLPRTDDKPVSGSVGPFMAGEFICRQIGGRAELQARRHSRG